MRFLCLSVHPSIHPSIPFPDSIKNGEDISYHVITLVSLPGHTNTARRVSTSRQRRKSIVYLSSIFVVLKDEEKKVGSGEQQWLGELQSRSCADDVFYFFLFFFCFSLLFGFAIFFSTLPPRNGFPGSMAIWNREIQALLPFQGGYTENGMVEVYLRILPKPSTLIH